MGPSLLSKGNVTYYSPAIFEYSSGPEPNICGPWVLSYIWDSSSEEHSLGSLYLTPLLLRRLQQEESGPADAVDAAAALSPASAMDAAAKAVAQFLFEEGRLSKNQIGNFIGGAADFNRRVLAEFVSCHQFTHLNPLSALRQFLWSFRFASLNTESSWCARLLVEKNLLTLKWEVPVPAQHI